MALNIASFKEVRRGGPGQEDDPEMTHITVTAISLAQTDLYNKTSECFNQVAPRIEVLLLTGKKANTYKLKTL